MSIKLVIALHGVGSSAHDITPYARALGEAASVEAIALDGPEAFDMGPTGRQWFSVRGVTEANRPERVERALSGLAARIDEALSTRGLERQNLLLTGFSQGAIMTLAAVATGIRVAGAIAVAGRMTLPAVPASTDTPPVLLLHDRNDPVMPFALALEAKERLLASRHEVALIASDGHGHSISPSTLNGARRFIVSLQA